MKQKHKRRILVGIVSLVFILSSLIPYALGLSSQTTPPETQTPDAPSVTTEGVDSTSGVTATSGIDATSGIVSESGVEAKSTEAVATSSEEDLEPNFSGSNALR